MGPSSTAIFLVLRRMRAPLIVLISLFAVSILGLTLMPGVDAEGKPWHMDPFEAFYFMSYTATTIGFGEIPHPFTTAQRAWVIVSIYLSVVAWAYAIGSVLALLQDRGFKEALSLQRFERRVRGLREPFLILAGFGQAGQVVARSLDLTDHRLVVLDVEPARIEALDLAAFRSDVPGLAADASNPLELRRAGLESSTCEGVIALTNDDQANLAIAMTAGLLRPDLPVVCRTLEDGLVERMRAFGQPMIVDPFNLFGDGLMLAVRAPQTARLVTWLTSDSGTKLPAPMTIPRRGRWVVCGYGRFGGHLAADLRRYGMPVTVIDPRAQPNADMEFISGDATDPDVLVQARLSDAVALAAASDNDISNLSVLAEAQRANPDLFLVGRQNDPANAPLFEALQVESMLVPTQLVAHEVLARIGDATVWRFVQEAQKQDDAWSTELLDRITATTGEVLSDRWTVDLDEHGAPALLDHVRTGRVQVGALLHDPQDRDRSLGVVLLAIMRRDQVLLAPPDDEPLAENDRLLLIGEPQDRRALDTVLSVPAAAEYVLSGRRIGQSWVWRTLVDR
ncbi:MAG: NAD-binding protein [Actinobacteria bacterium]|nr:NAD-binding protein [Micrococcales bacterium]MCB0903428.1 NAD-binding protein [Actinomycetota bacterium]MCO5299220.1 NAD-binding protein [Candidatus Nanopelagicales bacterium]MCB9429531.1 NAD-binding protein [Actinomycetota bacterium]HPE11667.1 NAD-binding protein [Actinomycetota bacterium]